MRFRLFGRNKNAKKVNKKRRKISLFDIQLKKIKKDKKPLSESRTRTVGEYLYRVIEKEDKVTDAIDQKAGTQLTFLPIAVTIFAGVGGLLLSKESSQKMSELWITSIIFYGMSLVAFIVSCVYTLFSLRVATFPGINSENIIDFEQNNENYYFTLGKHLEHIRQGLRDVNDKKASRLNKSQLALLAGLVFIVICFILLVIPPFFDINSLLK